jgi:hypothetical protein
MVSRAKKIFVHKYLNKVGRKFNLCKKLMNVQTIGKNQPTYTGLWRRRIHRNRECVLDIHSDSFYYLRPEMNRL